MAKLPFIPEIPKSAEDILDEVLKDLDEMEHSRDYWKSKALQYKMDLNGAQRGMRRLKTKLAVAKHIQSRDEIQTIKKNAYNLGLDVGYQASKRHLESWQEKCETLRKENEELKARFCVNVPIECKFK